MQLWEEKTGIRQAEDISEKPYVKYGTEAEQYLRELFKLDFPEYEVTYDQYDRIANLKNYPFVFATLDGVLREKQTGKKVKGEKKKPKKQVSDLMEALEKSLKKKS